MPPARQAGVAAREGFGKIRPLGCDRDGSKRDGGKERPEISECDDQRHAGTPASPAYVGKQEPASPVAAEREDDDVAGFMLGGGTEGEGEEVQTFFGRG